MQGSGGIAGDAGIWVLGTFTLYLLVLLGIGLYSSRFMDSVDDYVIGGRQIGPVVTGFSERADEKARDAAFEWTIRTAVLSDVPEVTLAEVTDAYKLFWLAQRPDGDVIVDSVRGTERPLDG